MKKRTEKQLAMLLCVLLASGMLASCGDTAGTASADTGAGTAESVTETETAEPPFIDALGEYDYGGKNFNMLIRQSRQDNLIAEEAIGEVFNDAVFERNSKIMERFNVNFTFQQLEDDSSAWNKQISASVMAGDGAYDVVMPDYWWGCETGGYFLNMLDYNSIMDFTKPWWCAGWNDSAEIFGQMYSAVGSICIDLYSNTECVFFNKALIASLDAESPYTLVTDHKWTLDKMLELGSAFGGDLNGDGKIDLDNDAYGITFDLQSGRAIMTSCGWKCSTKTADGGYAYEFMNDEFVALYDKVYTMINGTDYINYSNEVSASTAFANNRVLFYTAGMGSASGLRDMESDFGIVPFPLYDENQENYISYNFGTYYLAIPRSASDPEMSAVILEALNAESYHTVKDAYYEVSMKEKMARDEMTQVMLDLIVDSTYFDFTFVNESATDHIVMYFFSQIVDKRSGIAAAYEKKQKSYQKKLDALFETYASSIEE